ncbi:uncharacterized protein BJ212DRAFT_1321598 [Suillus subaureus]|uniref:Secreted protein n=1 Tax=Suillus subaureus TaxID=48587 RepID=A0A9P7EL41_9AGAM|nr:uncharacterized protein BJ212DRAFT_1321598 [Suillus subaureus]KAG1824644.1 hypothetical protein BJ212DRAFT_1321598 [Suillus subaureus]
MATSCQAFFIFRRSSFLTCVLFLAPASHAPTTRDIRLNHIYILLPILTPSSVPTTPALAHALFLSSRLV